MIIESEALYVPRRPRDFVLRTVGGHIRTRHDIYQALIRHNLIVWTTESIRHGFTLKTFMIWIHLKEKTVVTSLNRLFQSVHYCQMTIRKQQPWLASLPYQSVSRWNVRTGYDEKYVPVSRFSSEVYAINYYPTLSLEHLFLHSRLFQKVSHKQASTIYLTCLRAPSKSTELDRFNQSHYRRRRSLSTHVTMVPVRSSFVSVSMNLLQRSPAPWRGEKWSAEQRKKKQISLDSR